MIQRIPASQLPPAGLFTDSFGSGVREGERVSSGARPSNGASVEIQTGSAGSDNVSAVHAPDAPQAPQAHQALHAAGSRTVMDARLTRVSLAGFIPSPQASEWLPQAAARRLGVVPLACVHEPEGYCLTVACALPMREDLPERLGRQLPPNVSLRYVIVDEHDLPGALDRCYAARIGHEQMLTLCTQPTTARQWVAQTPDAVIRLLESLMLVATRLGVSDLHLSPCTDALLVRFRIDGVLHLHARLCASLHGLLLVRIKILAGIDIAETRRPQDGQFTQLIDARPIDFRVACFPTRVGQNIVLRVLDQKRRYDTLSRLKLPVSQQQQLRRLIRKPDGLFVVCGPTGSGKSNTLHALLTERDPASLNVMTLEDPVELIVPNVRQTSIDAEHAMDFAEGVRGLLRQDPDVLMIGEVRDGDSCAMAIRAAMSGHQVLTSVHAGSAIAGLSRLRELGASTAQLAETLSAVAALRLVREICPDCGGKCTNRASGIVPESLCEPCRGTGFQGRRLLLELLIMTPILAELLASDASPQQLQQRAIQQGFLTLRQESKALVEDGVTTLQEVERVLGKE